MSVTLELLAGAYGAGARLKAAAYRRDWLHARRLTKPVISIGNLTSGGTGKTPLVRWVVERLAARGRKAAILTRGYKREGGPDAVLIPPKTGRAPDPREVGDEPAWLARTLPDVPIGVSADRYRTGQLIEGEYPIDVFVLDDGFQHFALARALDVVALDITQDLSDRLILPAGLQREPVSALGRADVVMLTRTELDDPAPHEAVVREVNPGALLLRAQTCFRQLRRIGHPGTVEPETIVGRPIHAFCGIGNPEAFFRDLRLWGFDVAQESVFPDHHVYRNLNFAARSDALALVTTEKDAMNLHGLSLDEIGIPLLACDTDLVVKGVEAFDELLEKRLESFRAPETPWEAEKA